MGLEDDKRAAAVQAADLVDDGMRVGLGSGTTVANLLPALAARGVRVRCFASSPATEAAARAAGLDVEPFLGVERLEIAIDGADQITPDGWLIKGGGRAHTREKLLAAAAERFVVIAAADKLVERLRAPIPLELMAFGLAATLRRLAPVRLRGGPSSPDGGVIADWTGPVKDPAALSAWLSVAPGVIEHGLFSPALVTDLIVASDGVVERRSIPRGGQSAVGCAQRHRRAARDVQGGVSERDRGAGGFLSAAAASREGGAPLPLVRGDAVPWLSVAQMREVDRLMVDELGISLVRMMENAGRNLAVLARRLLGGGAGGRRVVVMAGPGGNGGGGLVAARHLAVAGARVAVRLATAVERLAPASAEQLAILRRMEVDVAVGPPADALEADLVLDALLGYSQAGDPRGDAAALIEWSATRPVLSLDTPSGLELTSGDLRRPTVRAEATLTLALPKSGLRAPGAADAVGALYLADISVPALVYERLGLRYASPFGAGTIVELEPKPQS